MRGWFEGTHPCSLHTSPGARCSFLPRQHRPASGLAPGALENHICPEDRRGNPKGPSWLTGEAADSFSQADWRVHLMLTDEPLSRRAPGDPPAGLDTARWGLGRREPAPCQCSCEGWRPALSPSEKGSLFQQPQKSKGSLAATCLRAYENRHLPGCSSALSQGDLLA